MSEAFVDPKVFRAEADERMTAEREETKYLIAPEHVPVLVRELAAQLPPHRFEGEGANRLPDPHHFVTTIYFDTASRAHYRAAVLDQEHNVKVRAKEYYDLHPSLAELATNPAQIVRYQPWVWFEIKRREGPRTLKRRFRLPKRHVPEFFAGGHLVPEALVQPGAGQSTEEEDLREVVKYCSSLEEPLTASALVNYRRLSFQDRLGALRVTLDLGLSFYAPPADLWSRAHALVRSTLGPSCGGSRQAVLEVKRRAACPAWLKRVLEGAGDTVPFSKFVAASAAVHGETRTR
ncbi:MAG TPA: VTC domain-containing protein [Polyangiaceae bacterium]